MAYGLKLINPGGTLVLDSEGFGMNYIGTASYYGTASMPQHSTDMSVDWVFNNGTAPAILTEYRITSSSSQLIPFLKLSSSYTAALISVSKINSNTWSILCYCSGSGLEIYCFVKTAIIPVGYGLALYDSSGNLSYNLVNAGSPLFFKSIAEFPNDTNSGSPVSSATITGAALNTYTIPAIFGWNLGYNSSFGQAQSFPPQETITKWQGVSQSFGLKIDSSGNLRRYAFTVASTGVVETGSDLPPGDNYMVLPATSVAVIEASGLVTS